LVVVDAIYLPGRGDCVVRQRHIAGGRCVLPAKSTEQTYRLTSGDVSKTIRVIETASNAGGESAPAASGQTVVVVPEVPVAVSPPSIAGSAIQGKVLSESHGLDQRTHELQLSVGTLHGCGDGIHGDR
jgi:hypothetical protein